MSCHVSPWVYPVWDSLCLLDLIDYFLFHTGEIFSYNLFKNFLIPFLFLFLFWDLYNSNVVVLILSQTSLRLSSILFILFTLPCTSEGFPGGSDGKESTCNVGDLGSIPEFGRSPGGGHGNPLQYSCLENPHEQRSRSLVGYSPWGCKELDVTE